MLRIHINKDPYKFAAAHMTIFSEGRKEPLHGHNYYVGLEVGLTEKALEKIQDFSYFKRILLDLVDAWDERILIQTANPAVKVQLNGESVDAVVCGKSYRFPKEEVILLSLYNISSELLAVELSRRFAEKLEDSFSPIDASMLTDFVITVHESRGQGASYMRKLP